MINKYSFVFLYLQLNQIFDKTFKLPALTKSLIIKLGPKTFFRLHEGFFHNDTVNQFVVEGNMSEYEKVEIGTDAFRGNNGPFPEIAFTNVFAIIILQRAFQQKPASMWIMFFDFYQKLFNDCISLCTFRWLQIECYK